MLKVQEKHFLPHLVQEELVADVKFILQEFRQYFCEVVSQETAQHGWNIEEDSDLYDLLHRPDLIDTLLRTFFSAFRLQKYCANHLDAVFPTSCELPLT